MQVVNGDKTLGENIALDIQDELFSIRPEVLGNIKTLSVVTSDRNEVWFLIPDTEEEYSKIMIYDYLRRTWVKRKSQKISSIAIVNSKLYSAGKKIYQEYVSNSFDGKFIEALKSFYKTFKSVWMKENKPQGFDIQDVRFGGLIMRTEHLRQVLRDYCNGKIDKIEELEDEYLKIADREDCGFIEHWYYRVVSGNIFSHGLEFRS